ncbi:MAG: hypothetical protein QXE76_00910 [Candidatus Bathyarchaeia archaeon]
MTKPQLSIKDVDFMFENMTVKVIANRDSPEIVLAGLKVGPFSEGEEYEVKFWVAKELRKAGLVRFREEDILDAVKLHKIHWKERVQSARQISLLPQDFFPKLRRYLAETKAKAVNNIEKMREYEKIVRVSHDIVNCRLRKIVSLASAPAQTNQVLANLTPEERILYDRLYALINEWRTRILRVGAEL